MLPALGRGDRAAGVGEAQIASIHAPIGLNIGAVSPAEIAVAIAALAGPIQALCAEREVAFIINDSILSAKPLMECCRATT